MHSLELTQGQVRPAVAPPVVGRALRGPAIALDPPTRKRAERQLGHDFSDVRIHHGETAGAAAAAVRADAFTVGREVVFGHGQFRPDSSSGQALLLHELVHVAQQRRGAGVLPSRPPMGTPGDRWEREAQATSLGAVSEAPVQVAGSWWEEKKAAAYQAMISAARTGRNANVAWLRAAVSHAPGAIQPALNGVISVLDEVSGVLDMFVMGIIGILVGFGEGVVGMVEGLWTLEKGVWHAVSALIADIWNGDGINRSAAFWSGVLQSLKGLPRALEARYHAWMAEFEHATPEKSGIMIAELTGQLLALIGSFALGGVSAAGEAGDAGAAAKALGAAGEAADFAKPLATVADLAKPAAAAADAAQPAAAAVDAAKVADVAKAAEAAKPTSAAAEAAKPAAAVKPWSPTMLKGGAQGKVPIRPRAPGVRPFVGSPSPARSVGEGATAYRGGSAATKVAPAEAPAPRWVLRAVESPAATRSPATGLAPSHLASTPKPVPFELPEPRPLTHPAPVELPKPPPLSESVPMPKTTPAPNAAPDTLAPKLMTGAVGTVGKTAKVAKPAPDPKHDGRERERRGRPTRLVLPASKSGPEQYRAYAQTKHLLQHDPAYERDRDAQAKKWDAGVKAGGHGGHQTHGMTEITYQRGVWLGLTASRIYRPNWTHRGNPLDHQVDHVIELQVLSPGDQASWGDTFINYELLDAGSNQSSGSQMRANIREERKELALYYKDPVWLTAVLRFDQIVRTGGGSGHRWSQEEIEEGAHIDVYDRYRRPHH